MSSSPKYRMANTLIHRTGRWLFSWYVKVVFNTYNQVKVHRTAALPEGAFILCSNHQSHLDAIILGYLGKGNYNRTAFIAAKDYWYDHWMRYHMSNLFFNLIPISRNQTSGFTIRQTIDMVKHFTADQKSCVIILPEGTRSVDGQIKAFKAGVITLAKECQLPIVPVYIHQSSRIWPKGSYYMRPGKLQVIAGKPILPEDLTTAADLREHIVTLSQLVK